MKKILAMILLLVCCTCALTACSSDMIGDFDYHYTPVLLKSIDLNMYIIGNPETEKANTTVANAITAYTAREYKINLVMHYVSEDNYADTLVADLADSTKSVDIMLINDKELFDTLYNAGHLACLDAAYDSKQFGTLNAKLPDALLAASLVNGSYYTVPNTRALGEYQYLVINRERAHYYHYSDTDLRAMKSLEDAQPLAEKIGADAEQYIRLVSGTYADKAKYESEGNVCNVVSKPVVTVEDAFASAFAINSKLVVGEDNTKMMRAMKIVFALHDDVYLRNLLQYGVKNTNYEINDKNEVTRFDDESALYEMNILYTGAYDIAYYCEAIAHTEASVKSAKQQNLEATFEP